MKTKSFKNDSLPGFATLDGQRMLDYWLSDTSSAQQLCDQVDEEVERLRRNNRVCNRALSVAIMFRELVNRELCRR